MGVFDFLTGGDKPQRQGPTAAENRLISATDRLDARRGGLARISNLRADQLASGRQGMRSDAIGASTADFQQQFRGPVTSNAQAVESALTRGRGLARIAQSRANEFDSQMLRDRIAFTGRGAARRGRGLAALTQAAGVQQGVSSAVRARRQSDAAGRANMLGTAAGIGLGFATRSNVFKRDTSRADTGITYDPGAGPQNTGSYA